MFCFVLSSTSEFTMVAPLKFFSVYSCGVLWRRALILVLGFALVFSQDSDSVSVELSPPAVNKKHIPHFLLCLRSLAQPRWWSRSHSLPLTLISNNALLQPLHSSKSDSLVNILWKKPSCASTGRTNVLINLNMDEELSGLYVKLYAVMWVLCTESVQAICGQACLMPSNYSPVCGTFISTRNYALPRLKICRRDDGWKAQKMNQI